MKDTYIVYKHTCPNGKCYIGITGRSAEQRWNFGHGYDEQLFGRAIKKYGWKNIEHEILFENLTLDEAYQKEIELIKEYKSFDKRYGYNCDFGGAGAEGHIVSDATRKKMSVHAKRIWSDESIREQLLVHLKELSSKNKGKKRSIESTAKTAEALSIPVLQYGKDFQLVCEHSSLMGAARSLGKTQNTLICRACKQKGKTAYGYYWRYKDDPITQDEIERLSKPKIAYNATPICQYTKDNEFVAEYDSIHDAERKTGFSYKGIWNALSNRRPSAYGYKWCYAT